MVKTTMINPIPYDGTGKLCDALAALHGISPKNHNKIAEFISEAKAALNINTKARRLPDNVKLALYRYHYDRLSPVSETVELFLHTEDVNIISHPEGNDSVEIRSQFDINDLVRIAFYTKTEAGRKRQVIALDGFYLNALMLVARVDKKGIPAWVQQALDGWAAFDPDRPITKQVKNLIIQALIAQIPHNRP